MTLNDVSGVGWDTTQLSTHRCRKSFLIEVQWSHRFTGCGRFGGLDGSVIDRAIIAMAVAAPILPNVTATVVLILVVPPIPTKISTTLIVSTRVTVITPTTVCVTFALWFTIIVPATPTIAPWLAVISPATPAVSPATLMVTTTVTGLRGPTAASARLTGPSVAARASTASARSTIIRGGRICHADILPHRWASWRTDRDTPDA
ncbi:hypothetical protein CASZ1_13490 [Cutibacterium acnes]|nr:hypothetical protein CASZ1_13490 [Cutibacterium acnes]BCB13446.1 hypothetical protein CASZ2_13500 [Cutibacterium acnes]